MWYVGGTWCDSGFVTAAGKARAPFGEEEKYSGRRRSEQGGNVRCLTLIKGEWFVTPGGVLGQQREGICSNRKIRQGAMNQNAFCILSQFRPILIL